MSVDFLVCFTCGDAFTDAMYYLSCECGAVYRDTCAQEQRERYPQHEEDIDLTNCDACDSGAVKKRELKELKRLKAKYK